ncbi:hypothetical protein NLX83_21690 [Allokutzneria sp. A3M-2-11 16]|uniref:hypothetical protein n=1 Tax=Allokutzneria sp. A3M-2-11 16 TaxID=2962043 RepID=UPI0020B6F7D7|nr:hypothetical protein [Allokutzneria sp. A3M-2-11 16]MCP3801883.1 hypothetical protein [Allokutzneria sp. A3M-2-11 16]
MHKLPSGLTGFEPAPRTDLKALRAACHDAARRTRGRVIDIVEAQMAMSYHAFVIGYRDRTLAVLANAFHPLLAIAEPPHPRQFCPPFREDPDLAAALDAHEPFRVLSTEELGRPLSTVDLSGLTEAEHRELRTWKAATVGDVVFNHWD